MASNCFRMQSKWEYIIVMGRDPFVRSMFRSACCRHVMIGSGVSSLRNHKIEIFYFVTVTARAVAVFSVDCTHNGIEITWQLFVTFRTFSVVFHFRTFYEHFAVEITATRCPTPRCVWPGRARTFSSQHHFQSHRLRFGRHCSFVRLVVGLPRNQHFRISEPRFLGSFGCRCRYRSCFYLHDPTAFASPSHWIHLSFKCHFLFQMPKN